MTNTGMFFRMLLSAVFRRRSRAVMAVVASLVGAATLSCLAMICIAVPQQMNQEMRAYGANLIVTPLADSENGKSGIDDAMVEHTTQMVSAKGSEKHATYRYENVRVNAAPYVMAGVNPAQVRNLNHHWVVDGSWPSAGKVLVGRDVADAMGLKVGGSITIGYRASDNAASSGQASQPGTDGTSDGQTSSGSTGAQQTQNGHVSSDIMDTSGTEFRVAGIVDTGGSEDSIIYALAGDVDKLTGSTRGVDVIEYSSGASDLTALVNSINDMTSMHVKAQQVTKITASDTRVITMLQTRSGSCRWLCWCSRWSASAPRSAPLSRSGAMRSVCARRSARARMPSASSSMWNRRCMACSAACLARRQAMAWPAGCAPPCLSVPSVSTGGSPSCRWCSARWSPSSHPSPRCIAPRASTPRSCCARNSWNS